jgi:hypothetical protein
VGIRADEKCDLEILGARCQGFLVKTFPGINVLLFMPYLARICFACGGFSPVSPGIHDAANAIRLSDTDQAASPLKHVSAKKKG